MLEPFTPADIPRLLGWIDSHELLIQWAGPTFRHPLDEAQLLAHLAQIKGHEPSLLSFKVVATASGETVGHVDLGNVNRLHRTGSIARVLVGPSAQRGQGIGTAIMRQILTVAFDRLRLHRVDLRVFDFNTAAIAAYERVGFRKEGLLRESCKVGDRYWSAWVMSILEDEWARSRAAGAG